MTILYIANLHICLFPQRLANFSNEDLFRDVNANNDNLFDLHLPPGGGAASRDGDSDSEAANMQIAPQPPPALNTYEISV